VTCGGVYFQPFFADFLTTLSAKAIFAFFKTGECLIDLGNFRGPLALCSLGHRLLLQSIHARKPSDALLVERDRFARVGAAFAPLLQFTTPRNEDITGLLIVHRLSIAPVVIVAQFYEPSRRRGSLGK